MLGRDDKSNTMHKKARRITGAISVASTLLIAGLYSANIAEYYNRVYDYERYNKKYRDFVYFYLPPILLGIDCVLLLTGLVWICHSLRHDPHVMGNERFMACHLFLLTITLGSQGYVSYGLSAHSNNIDNYYLS